MTSSNPSSNPSTGTSFRNFSLARRGNRMKFVPANSNEFVLKASPDSTTAVSLTWNEPETKPDTYRIERSTDGISFSTVTSAGADIFSYTDTGRTESTEYYYRIVPVLGGADQPASNVASTWTVPSTPTGLTATAISSTQINLAWTDVSTGNTAQSIQRRSPAGSGSYSFIASVGATANSYSDTGLIAATQYEYQVAATNPATQSAWSTAANATTTGGGPPSASWTLDFSTGEPWSNGTNYVFSSTASTSRTYVDSSGYVAPCVANLILQSEDFTTTWVNSDTTESGNTVTAPDNTTTADTITEGVSGAGFGHDIRQTVTRTFTIGESYTFTVYAKAGTATVLQLALQVAIFGNNEWANFDLTNGVLGSVGTDVTGSDATITSVGNGWYRCKLTAVVQTGGASAICVCGFTNNQATSVRLPQYAVTSGNEKSLYLWGAQLVTGSAALPYSATTTSSNGIPRLTHNSSGSRLGLLVEGQRTNLLQRSGEFENAYYVFGDTTVAGVSSPVAPDNSTDAAEMKETATTARHAAGANLTLSNGTYTFSVYVKKQSRQYVGLLNTSGNTYAAIFDLNNNAAFSASTSIGTPNGSYGSEDFGNGWYRIWITVTTLGNPFLRVFLSDRAGFTGTLSGSMPSYAGSTSESVYVWGLQYEEAATPSSYIPTTTQSVTREADIAYVETADVTNWGRPGSFVVEYYKPTGQSGGVVVADDDGAGNAGRLGLEYSAGGPRIVYGTSGAGSGGTDTAGLNKIGWAWNGSGAATRSALNGSALNTSLATSFDPTLTDGINLGGNIDWSTLPLTVSGQPNVVIRRVRFWNSQLSAADLNTLTT